MTNSQQSPAPETAAPPAGTARYDSYVVIHKALRALAADTLVRLGRMDTDDDADTHAVIEQVRRAIALGESHLLKEETFVHPAMEARAPGSTRRAATDHASHTEAFARIRAACDDVAGSRGAVRAAAAKGLYRRYALLMAEDLAHMDTEETANNAVLWARHTDAEIVALVERLVASIPPETLTQYLPWMVAANAPRDRVKLLEGLKQGMPNAAFFRVVSAVLPELLIVDRGKLVAALGWEFAPLTAA